MPDYTELKGFAQFGEALHSTQIANNVVQFFNWGLLNKGGFFNVRMPTSGTWGGDFSRLRPVSDPRYTDGQLWESSKLSWVWESGLSYNIQPIRSSGVWVNGSFQPLSGVGSYQHKFNYELGQVLFTSAIPTSSTVRCEFSYRAAPFVLVDTPWFMRVLKDSDRVDAADYLTVPSGNYKTPAQHRLTLPAVGIEVVPNGRHQPMMIGGGQIIEQNVIFHIVAGTAYERNHLADIIRLQSEKKIRMFDVNDAPFPLRVDGSLNSLPQPSGAMTYPDLVRGVDQSGFYYKDMRFVSTDMIDMNNYNNGLFSAMVNTVVETYMGEI